MKEITGDLFQQGPETDAICITTNGFIKNDGTAVMGRGVAQQAKRLWPWVPKVLAEHIRENGNVVTILREDSGGAIIAFPVKHAWWEPADTALIRASCRQLVALADADGWQRIVLPRPGCGNGQLDWDKDVKRILEAELDNRFYIIDRPRGPVAAIFGQHPVSKAHERVHYSNGGMGPPVCDEEHVRHLVYKWDKVTCLNCLAAKPKGVS